VWPDNYGGWALDIGAGARGMAVHDGSCKSLLDGWLVFGWKHDLLFNTNDDRLKTSGIQRRLSMRIIRGRHNISKQDQGCVVTIGNFDGVHRGHQAILHEVNRLARKKACKSLLICFEPQPREFFEAYQAPARLTRFREKVVQLAASGLDRLLCLQFNDDIRSLSVASFVDLLVQELEVEALFIGDDFRFGADRSGDYEALKAAGGEFGFDVDKFSTITHGQKRISSTLIRQHLEAGRFAEAEQLLGRPYAITGRVVFGRQLGRTIGTPTANIQLHRYRAPISGVFLVELKAAGSAYHGVANVGVRPTVEQDDIAPILEVHLLDFSGDLYGSQVEVTFTKKIREEQKFDGLDVLKSAIEQDIATARRLLTD